MPTGFIQVDGGLLLDIFIYFLDRFFQDGAHTTFLGWDTSKADLGVEDRFHDFLHVSLTDAKATAQYPSVACVRGPKLPEGLFDGHSALFWHPQARQVSVCN